MYRRVLFRFLFFLLSYAVVEAMSAQAPINEPTPPSSSLFNHLHTDEDSIVSIELVTDLRDLARNRRVDEYRQAALKWGAMQEYSIPVGVKPRGKLRRRICDFPPLKLKVDKDEAQARMLEDHRKMKLVTHCMHGNGSRNLVLREYLAYQLYRELTDAAFEVQLVKVVYQDDQKLKRRWERYGMFIEPNAQLARRLGGKVETLYHCAPDETDREQEDLMAAFQMMIGNQDYTVKGSHNVKWIRRRADSTLVPVPYDFDYSGFVDAHYAVPLPAYPQLESIRDRMYIGRAQDETALEASLQRLRDKRDAFETRISAFELLPAYERNQLLRYLDRFFERVDAEFCAKRRVLP